MQSHFSGGFAVEGEFYVAIRGQKPATRAAIVTKPGRLFAISGPARGKRRRPLGLPATDQQAVDHTPQNETPPAGDAAGAYSSLLPRIREPVQPT